MDIKISEDLMSAVLDKEVTNIEKGCTENELKVGAYFGVARQSFHINIYELAHKCKSWAYEQGYLIGLNSRQGVTLIDINTNNVLRFISINDLSLLIRFELNLCQWILENKDKK